MEIPTKIDTLDWYWDPEFDDPLAGRECNLLMSVRDQMIRLVLDLAYDACEKENDALGLRGLRGMSPLSSSNAPSTPVANNLPPKPML